MMMTHIDDNSQNDGIIFVCIGFDGETQTHLCCNAIRQTHEFFNQFNVTIIPDFTVTFAITTTANGTMERKNERILCFSLDEVVLHLAHDCRH